MGVGDEEGRGARGMRDMDRQPCSIARQQLYVVWISEEAGRRWNGDMYLLTSMGRRACWTRGNVEESQRDG